MSNQSKTARKVNDAYFTNSESAKFCHSFMFVHDWLKHDQVVLDPCVGAGALVKDLSNKVIAQDIKNYGFKDTIIQDYLTAPSHPKGNIDVVLANPPFGTACNLAVPFFNKACQDADRVAFIIPATFRKASVTDKLDLNYWKIVDVDLPNQTFTLPDGSTKWVRTIFQMWERRSTPRKRIKDQVKITDYFIRLAEPEPGCYAFRTQGAKAGKVLDGLNHSPASTAFLRGSKDRILAHNWTKLASNTAGIPAIGLLDVAYHLLLEDKGIDIKPLLN
jgi:hypothetical protein